MQRLLRAALAALALACAAPAHASSSAEGRVVAHPSGCPHRLFCGCGAAVYLFGQPLRRLWRAAAWFGFPRAQPGPGMAAVRRHHVFVLIAPIKDDIWLSYDANSGHRLTRIHPRSIRGTTIVDPRG